jgi:hypothetical protein
MIPDKCRYEFKGDITRIIDVAYYMAQQHPGHEWDANTGAIVFDTVTEAMVCRMYGDSYGISYVGRAVMQ